MVLNAKTIAVTAVAVAGLVFLAGQSFAASSQGGTKPGWGYGDQNHTHTGPPGQSVRAAK